MKLKCNHNRRALVTPFGTTLHSDDGSECDGSLTMGDRPVVITFTKEDNPTIGPKGTCILLTSTNNNEE